VNRITSQSHHNRITYQRTCT